MRNQTSLVLLLVAGTWGCSDNDGPAPVTIGPEGGVVEYAGARLAVPGGALTAATEISIAATAEATPNGYVGFSTIYQFSPEGLTFAAPAEVRIEFEAPADGAQLIWSMASGDGFESRGGSVEGSTLTAQVDHFSRGFVGRSAPTCGGSGSVCPDTLVCQNGTCVPPGL
jgi:hypothetical protein